MGQDGRQQQVPLATKNQEVVSKRMLIILYTKNFFPPKLVFHIRGYSLLYPTRKKLIEQHLIYGCSKRPWLVKDLHISGDSRMLHYIMFLLFIVPEICKQSLISYLTVRWVSMETGI